ncbi:MAG: nitrogenase-stabilizing/protective protein NifW [Cyanobacteria bacterium SBLK]|nr:nitrogenase-stabilizing/protective protein NifW [Cyanobacteria bacterium SBLK]
MTATTQSLAEFKKLVNAEDYLQFFAIEYDEKFVNVNRLHILKQFSLLIEEVNRVFPDLGEAEKLEKYCESLKQAYGVFASKSPLETKLFKVFHDKQKNIVLLQDVGQE